MQKDTRQRVMQAADELLYAGIRPTQQNVRERIGQGSLTTINKALNLWWSELGGRFQAQREASAIPQPLESMMLEIWRLAKTQAEHDLREQQAKARAEIQASRQQARETQEAQVAAIAEAQAKLDRAYARIEDQQSGLDRMRQERDELEARLVALERERLALQRELKSSQALAEKLEKKLQDGAKSRLKNKEIGDLFETNSSSGSDASAEGAIREENRNLKRALDQMDAKYARQQAALDQALEQLKKGAGQRRPR